MDQQAAVFVWENLGPTHHDRLRAAASTGLSVTAIQFRADSLVYSWEGEAAGDYRVVTLFDSGETMTMPRIFIRLWRAIRQSGAATAFLCHYNYPPIFAVALAMRLLSRRRLVTMNNSKFDDYPRTMAREQLKRWLLRPYHAALTSSRRSRDYLAFLGIPAERSAFGYNTIDTARIRAQLGNDPAPPLPPGERDFVIVARLVPKKNIAAALEAMAQFSRSCGPVRRLTILGDGPMEDELKAKADALGISNLVTFAGFVQTAGISRALYDALALILPSREEQFGFVINEAMAMGVPVICTSNAGAVDILVDNCVNGFVIDPDRPETIARAMRILHEDETLRAEMAKAARATAGRGDTRLFAGSVEALSRARL